MKIKFILFSLSFLLVPGLSLAQSKATKKADEEFRDQQYYNALDLYKKAYGEEKKPLQKSKILYRIAECYRNIRQLDEAEVYYVKAREAGYPDPMAIFWLADIKKTMGQYDEALEEYYKYRREVPRCDGKDEYMNSLTLAKKWIENPAPYKIEVSPISGRNSDLCPAYSNSMGSELYFTSIRMNPRMDCGELQMDIFVSKKDESGKWSNSVLTDSSVNTAMNESSPSLTKDLSKMYFTRCILTKKKKKLYKLYVAERQGESWTNVHVLPFCKDSFQYQQPGISASGDTLFFSSDMSGGQGQCDIWMSVWNTKLGKFSDPINLGPKINSYMNESYPYINSDGSALYFSSDRDPGMGGLDIYRSERNGSSWSNPVNLTYPMNSPYDDFGIIFEGKLNKGYFSSDRKGGKGDNDIYSFEFIK